MSGFLADDLVVKTDIDVSIFVPPHLRHYFIIEYAELLKFLSYFNGLSGMYRLVSDAHEQVEFLLRRYVDLLQLAVPELIVAQKQTDGHEVLPCKRFAHVSCHHDEVGFITLGRHAIAILIKIVVVAVVGHDAEDGDALLHDDVDDAARCLVASGLLDEGLLDEFFLNRMAVDGIHQLAFEVEVCCFQFLQYVFLRHESGRHTVGYLHIDAGATFARTFLHDEEEGVAKIDRQANEEN